MLFNTTQEVFDSIGIISPSVTWSELYPEIELATNEIAKLIGKQTILIADRNEIFSKLLKKPIAYLAVKSYYANNLVNHKSSGLKVSIDNDNEKMAWQWMIDFDAQSLEQKAYQSLDVVISFIIDNDFEEWRSSSMFKRLSSSPIKSLEDFECVFPIDNSYRFFYMLLPFITEAYNSLKPIIKDTEHIEKLQPLINGVLPLMAIKIAVNRLSISVMPSGLSCRFSAQSQTLHASTTPNDKTLNYFLDSISEDIESKIEKIKQFISPPTPFTIVNNSSNNKYFRT